MFSCAEVQSDPTCAVIVTVGVADFSVIIVPPVVGSGANVTAVASDALQVDVPLPPVTMAGTWKVCVVLSVTNAEYIGAKWICSELLVVHAAPSVAESPLATPVSGLPPVTPPLELEHAASATPAPHTPTRTALTTPGRNIRRRMTPP